MTCVTLNGMGSWATSIMAGTWCNGCSSMMPRHSCTQLARLRCVRAGQTPPTAVQRCALYAAHGVEGAKPQLMAPIPVHGRIPTHTCHMRHHPTDQRQHRSLLPLDAATCCLHPTFWPQHDVLAWKPHKKRHARPVCHIREGQQLGSVYRGPCGAATGALHATHALTPQPTHCNRADCTARQTPCMP